MTLFDAIAHGDFAAVEAALRASTDLNELGAEGRTPLIAAAALGRLDVVRLLVARGAEPGWKDEAQETAILKAAANGYPEVVAFLSATATDEDRDLARAFLAAYGKSHGPEYQYDASRLQKKVADVVARAADFVGHHEPRERLERQARAEQHKPKK